MDPVTTAIVSAISAGVVGAAPKLVEKEVVDAYKSLKGLLKRKFGADSGLVSALHGLEAHPDSGPRTGVVQEEVATAGADRDPDILNAVKDLLDTLKANPISTQHIQTATGNYNAQASGNASARVIIGNSGKKDQE
jgi:hypothetical protein